MNNGSFGRLNLGELFILYMCELVFPPVNVSYVCNNSENLGF